MKHKMKIFSCILLFAMVLLCGCDNNASETDKTESVPNSPEKAESTVSPEADSGKEQEESPEDSSVSSTSRPDSSDVDTPNDPLEQKKESFYAAQQKVGKHFQKVKKSVKKISLTEEQEEDYRYFEPIAIYYEEMASEQLQGCTEEEIDLAIQGLEELDASLTSFEKAVIK